MRLKTCLLLSLCLYSLSAYADKENCLSVPLGITVQTLPKMKRTIAAAKAEVFLILSDAEDEAELSAKLLFKNSDSLNISGVYRYESCASKGFSFVAVAIDEDSQKVRSALKSKLSESFSKYPVMK